MEKEKGEIKEIFIKLYKQERLMGTLVVIAMIIASIILCHYSDKQLTNIIIGYISFCILIYFKFLYDIKRKLNKRLKND